MNFTDAIRACFTKYADFNGRAKRPEYWWFVLFLFVAQILLIVVSFLMAIILNVFSGFLILLLSLATIFPSLAAGSRRLHDMNKSGWMQLLWLIPILGWIYLIYLLAQPSDAGDNQYGSPPAN